MGVLVLVGHLRRRHKQFLALDRHDVLDHMCAAEAERPGRENGQHPTGGVGKVEAGVSRPESASACAAVSAVEKVPCQLDPFVPCTRSLQTHPPARPRRRTLRYTGWRVSLNMVRPAGRFGGSDHNVWCGPCSWSSDGDAASIDRSKLVEELMKCDLLR